jgi:hypothetical protein
MMRRCCFLLSLILGATLAVRADDAVPKGFEPLFNGKNLTGWKVMGGKADAWGADAGVLFVKGGGGGWLMTEKEYGDFELLLEYKLPEKGNSGVALRAPLQGQPHYDGMEIQILDDVWHKANYKACGKKTGPNRISWLP